jgi:hypothetical protein
MGYFSVDPDTTEDLVSRLNKNCRNLNEMLIFSYFLRLFSIERLH